MIMATLELSQEPLVDADINLNKQSQSFASDLPSYDKTLISTLEHDHEDLFNLYNQVLASAKNEEFSTLQLSLVEFATSFTTHIKVEDEQLYGYLIFLASHKSELEQKVVADFADEMKEISSSIFNILSHSPYIPVSKQTVVEFTQEFENIGALLTDRIEREEKVLYPIYKNSQK